MTEIANRRRAAGRRGRSNMSGLFFAAPYALVFLVFILIPYLPKVAAYFDLFFVNSLPLLASASPTLQT